MSKSRLRTLGIIHLLTFLNGYREKLSIIHQTPH